MFTAEQREQTRARIEAMARGDQRVVAGALIGSLAAGAGDAWSDIDLTYGIRDGANLSDVLQDWTETISREFGLLDWFDLGSGASVYRVFLLASGLEVDLSVTPQQAFSLRGPRVQVLFGAARREEGVSQPEAHDIIGLGWHHVIHARSAIERGAVWRAEYWISALRDHTLALACLRLGENAVHARGMDRLPVTVTEPFTETLVQSLAGDELRRALAAVTRLFLSEVEACDATLAERLGPLLREISGA